MSTATVTSKGQVTIPAEVRRNLGLKTGSRVDFVRMDDGTYELVPATGTVTALKGCVPAPARPVTVEQMEVAIDDAVADGTWH
ncbi:MAG: AbrB/MazE/SpoVT family DNA-binding domain-containing protein [Euzebyaceae bacterium]|nr:AbrB/MazE/SpoVT family DNA-binding domain-containing protein [Euzebyaceae bacterium]